MARFNVAGMAELDLSFRDLAELPDAVLDSMLDAGADVLIRSVQSTATTMLSGPYSKGAVASALVKGKKSRAASGRKLMLNFKGKQHGEPLARIAYVNEYGKEGQPARPFLLTAVERSTQDVAQAEEKVYDDYLKSRNL